MLHLVASADSTAETLRTVAAALKWIALLTAASGVALVVLGALLEGGILHPSHVGLRNALLLAAGITPTAQGQPSDEGLIWLLKHLFKVAFGTTTPTPRPGQKLEAIGLLLVLVAVLSLIALATALAAATAIGNNAGSGGPSPTPSTAAPQPSGP
jgi:hypothetical protein